MRILWVEDLDSDNCPESDLESIYEWKRVSTYFDAKSEIKDNITQYDLVLLDINLTGSNRPTDLINDAYLEGVPEKEDSPFELDQESFLKEAGFHLYIQLLEQGFPVSNIAFLSANVGGGQQTYNVFKTKFEEARIKPPRAFEKNAIDQSSQMEKSPFESDIEKKSELAAWLSDPKTETPYIKLRRAMIDSCNILKKLDQTHKSGSAHGKTLTSFSELRKEMPSLEIQDFNDRLHELKNILPCRVPDDKKNLLKRLARTVVHQWDKKGQGEYRSILQTARNWLSHGDMETSEKDVAFLFVLHVRSIVDKMPEEHPLIEKLFLSLFESSKLPSNLDDLIKKSYLEMQAEYKETKECKEYLCKQLYLYDNKCEKNRYIDFVKSYQAHREHTLNSMPDMKYLYRSFFHQFLGRKDQKVSKEVFDDEEMKAYAQAWIKLADF